MLLFFELVSALYFHVVEPLALDLKILLTRFELAS
jgi:hypothetical protein